MLKIFKKKTVNYSDAELVAHYQKSGDMGLLGILYERYTALIYGVCLKILKNETEAEDAFMEIFEKLSKKVKQHRIQQFKPWLYMLVKNHCLEILRKKKKHLTISYDTEIMQSGEDMRLFIEESVNGKLDALDSCLKELAAEQKSCVELFYFQNKTYKEIAELKKIALGKTRSFIQNGRRNLKICIEKKEKIQE